MTKRPEIVAEWHIYILIITARTVDRKLIGRRRRTMAIRTLLHMPDYGKGVKNV